MRIALEGTAPSALISTLAHDTCIPIPAQAVIVAKKHEIMRALDAAQNAFDAVRESVEGVLGSASLPENEGDARSAGAALIQLPQLLRPKTKKKKNITRACEMAAELIQHLLRPARTTRRWGWPPLPP